MRTMEVRLAPPDLEIPSLYVMVTSHVPVGLAPQNATDMNGQSVYPSQLMKSLHLWGNRVEQKPLGEHSSIETAPRHAPRHAELSSVHTIDSSKSLASRHVVLEES